MQRFSDGLECRLYRGPCCSSSSCCLAKSTEPTLGVPSDETHSGKTPCAPWWNTSSGGSAGHAKSGLHVYSTRARESWEAGQTPHKHWQHVLSRSGKRRYINILLIFSSVDNWLTWAQPGRVSPALRGVRWALVCFAVQVLCREFISVILATRADGAVMCSFAFRCSFRAVAWGGLPPCFA